MAPQSMLRTCLETGNLTVELLSFPCRYMEWSRGTWILQSQRLKKGCGPDWKCVFYGLSGGSLHEESRQWMAGNIIKAPLLGCECLFV